jgi:hypothetical protein
LFGPHVREIDFSQSASIVGNFIAASDVDGGGTPASGGFGDDEVSAGLEHPSAHKTPDNMSEWVVVIDRAPFFMPSRGR